MKEKWNDYVKHYCMPKSGNYRYYTTEKITDELESLQDAFKREKEIEAISSVVKNSPSILIDFGCGIGRNLEVLQKELDKGALVIGVEPDERRARIASGAGNNCLIVNSDKRFLLDSPKECKVDYVLCCQVLGHTSTDESVGILNAIFAKLSDDGIVQLLVPFINSNLNDSIADYYHYCDLQRLPDDKNFRVSLSKKEFNLLTIREFEDHILPVRSFSLDVPMVQERGEVTSIAIAMPPSFSGIVPSGFDVLTSIYSVHKWVSGQPLIGDISIVIKRGEQ